MIINHNMNAMNAHRNMSANTVSAGKSMEKLSSGLRINKAGDDAAGLAISEKMRGQIRGLDQASRNAQDGISLIQTAEGALNETHSILQRMRELAVQSSTDTATSTDREQIQKEVDQLASEITRISNTTEFNTKNLLAGGLTGQKFQIGANQNQDITLNIGKFDAFSLGVTGGSSASVTSGSSATSTSLTNTATIAPGKYSIDGSVDTAATSATVTAGSTATTDQSGRSAAERTINITVDGTTSAIQVDATSFANMDALVSNINTKISGSPLAGKLVAGKDGAGTSLTFTAASKGLNSTITVYGDTGNTLGIPTAPGSALTDTGSNAQYDLNLRDKDGVIVETLNNQTSYSLTFTNGLVVNMNETSLESLSAAAPVSSSGIEVVASAAAVTGGDGTVVTEATVGKGILVTSQSRASSAITTLDTAIKTVSDERSKLGAFQNRLEHTIANLGTSSENLTAAESRIRDVDMAKEMMTFSKNNILSQAAQAMLAQANQQPQGVLQLLR